MCGKTMDINNNGGGVNKPETKVKAFACTNLLNAKYLSLTILVFQMVGNVLMIRTSRASGAVYLYTTVVFTAEIMKTVVNTFIEFNVHRKADVDPDSSFFRHMKQAVFVRDTAKLAVPAFLYVVQNNLVYVALENLSVPVYMILNQGKLLTTAILSRIMLDKRLSLMQYFSLILLAIGVATIQLSSASGGGGKDDDDASKEEKKHSSNFLGFIAVVLSCFTSSFAGVFFERMLKNRDASSASGDAIKRSVYVRNVQLSLWSIPLAFVPLATKDWEAISRDGFYQGWNPLVGAICVSGALGGLVVSLVMKHADNVLKGFATSIAIFVASALAVMFQDADLNLPFGVGSVLVLSSVKIYSKYPWKPADIIADGAGDEEDLEAAKPLVSSTGNEDDSPKEEGATVEKRVVVTTR